MCIQYSYGDCVVMVTPLFITFDGKKLDSKKIPSENSRLVLDTGTTFSYFRDDFYYPIIDEVHSYIVIVSYYMIKFNLKK